MKKLNLHTALEFFYSKKLFKILSSLLFILGLTLAMVVLFVDTENKIAFEIFRYLVVLFGYFYFSLLVLRFLR